MFSILMATYAGENPSALEAALFSLVNQTVAVKEVILIKDGMLSEKLETVLTSFFDKLPLVIHALPKSSGLPVALNAGLQFATQPWIMRFDSDDVCVPDRLEQQLRIVESGQWQLIGGQIDEFDSDPSKPLRTRSVPCSHEDIVRFSALRNPFNHMTVCYPRLLALEVGGYPLIPTMQDYGLWMLMISKGAKCYNSSEILVHARVGNGFLNRRGGLAYVKSELMLQNFLVSIGAKSRIIAYWHFFLRSSIFLSPSFIRALVYSKALRNG